MVLSRREIEMTPRRHLSATPHERSGNRHPSIGKLAVPCDCTANGTKIRRWDEDPQTKKNIKTDNEKEVQDRVGRDQS